MTTEPKPRGVVCPGCGSAKLRVYRVRKPMRGRTVRYRECRSCGQRLVTNETASHTRPRRLDWRPEGAASNPVLSM